MKFDIGYYKVKIERGYFGSSFHYMRVFMNGKTKYIQIDHGIPQKAEDCEEDMIHRYRLIKRLNKPIEVNQLKLSVNWRDEDGDEFNLTAKDNYVLNKIFIYFPRIAKAFGVDDQKVTKE
jgi:hypothetical protein